MTRPAILVLALCASIPAQIETEDPRKEVQEILERVADELKQVDELLDKSSRSRADAQQAYTDKVLDHARTSQKKVVQGIDELLKAAQKLKSDGD